MRLDRLTIRAQEAVQQAQSIAERMNHQNINAEHLLLALINQTESIVPTVLQKLGVQLPLLRRYVEAELKKLPQVHGASVASYITPCFKQVMDKAFEEAER